MMVSGDTRIAGVIGSPIKHSLSPLMMSHWIKAAGVNGVYLPLAAEPDMSVDGLKVLSRLGFTGVNVTLPFKTLALEAADTIHPEAERAGAANLLVFESRRIIARNTDIFGITASLDAQGVSFKNRTVLILGAGGVSRAIIVAAQRGGARSICLTNRTAEKTRQLCNAFSLEPVLWSERQASAEKADIIFNATSLGMDGQSDPGIDWSKVKPGAIAFDTVYTPRNRPFADQAMQAGHLVIDGLSMLISQAKPSFEAFFQAPVPPDVDMEAILREALS